MKIIKIIRNILITLLILFLCILIYSEQWVLTAWDSSINFSTIVYQLFSPLKGTGGGVLQSYIESCIYPILLITGVCVAVFCYQLYLRKRVIIRWEINIFGKKIFDHHDNKLFVRICIIFLVCLLCGIAWMKAVTIGVIDYIKQISHNSTIFEEEYVAPADVEILFPENKKNLILIYLESMETTYASVEDGGAMPINYIPELTELAYNNTFFSDDMDFGGGSGSGAGWTMEALLASSAGIPYKLGINGNEAGMYEEFLPGVITLGDILLDNGYKNYFMCGSDVSFAGRNDYYQQHGNYTLIDWVTAQKEGFVEAGYYNGFWGMEDEILFAYAKEKLSVIAASGDPFNFTLLTVDTHHPDGYICGLCDNQYNQQYANAIACSSRQVNAFINWIQAQVWYDDTVIILVGDHLSMVADFCSGIGDYERKIYNCFINLSDELAPVETKNRTFTIIDMFPSILAAMDIKISGDRLGLGVNLFSDEATIPEKIGLQRFCNELESYSNFYFKHFIAGDS